MTTPEKPAANKTSEFVAFIASIPRGKTFDSPSGHQLAAIAAKYQRMEEALMSEPCHCTHEDDLCHRCTIGQLALAFDPLAHD